MLKAPLLLLPLLLVIAACTGGGTAEELLPLPASLRGANTVESVTVKVRTATAPADVRSMIETSIREAAERWGLRSGRAVALTVEVHDFNVSSTGSALFGGEDRLAGPVYVSDAVTGERLGHLYIDLNRRTPGLVGLLTRGGNLPQQLSDEFGARVARALSGRASPPD